MNTLANDLKKLTIPGNARNFPDRSSRQGRENYIIFDGNNSSNLEKLTVTYIESF